MKLGLAYNVFDGHELLEWSIRSAHEEVDYVCVVYQLKSNFGADADPNLMPYLERLVAIGLVDELVAYTPHTFNDFNLRKSLVSPEAEREYQSDDAIRGIGAQFFNELMKRETGRQRCAAAGCTHFITMDTDELYKAEQVRSAKQMILRYNYEVTACRMRLFVKSITYEYFPPDNVNCVTFICKIKPALKFSLAAPYKYVLLDPTRRLEPYDSFHFFPRTQVEMYHLTNVRMNIKSKLSNVSNRANLGDTSLFLSEWASWKGPQDGVLHPHPHLGAQFYTIRCVANPFPDIVKELSDLCAKCFVDKAQCQCTK